MAPPSKSPSPHAVPPSMLLGANVVVPQLQPSFSSSVLPALSSDVFAALHSRVGQSAGGDSPLRGVGLGSDEGALFRALQRERGDSAGLRASLDRTERTLSGVCSRLMEQDQELRRVKTNSASQASRIQHLDDLVDCLTTELGDANRRVSELQVALANATDERSSASLRFRFFQTRWRRARRDVNSLNSNLRGRLDELRFTRVALQEAEEDAREARRELARLWFDSARVLQRLRSRLGDLLEAHSSRVPGEVYRHILDRLRSYIARFGPLEGALAGDMDGDFSSGEETDAEEEAMADMEGEAMSGAEDDVAIGGEGSNVRALGSVDGEDDGGMILGYVEDAEVGGVVAGAGVVDMSDVDD
ncbi:uncharacterized protein SCHCODRAFT_02601947 [Schizophyllum commune H4-8]|nr:uncharacterized protein SCHCODRAFT_02601947 [Schizophyllum commune H4-8]KAI5888427.1 hypothetical protein SCHCODRAFT_02601947 [Schizophyllum commune H4-8]